MPESAKLLKYHQEKVVLLAGGTGSRMGELSKEHQKCCLPIDDEPLIVHLINELSTVFKTLHLLIAVQHHSEEVIAVVSKHIAKNPSITAEFLPHKPKAELIGVYVSMRNILNGDAPFMRVSGDMIASGRTYENSAQLSRTSRLPLTVTASTHVDEVDTHFLMKPQINNTSLLGEYRKPNEVENTEGWLRDLSIMCWQNGAILFDLIDKLYSQIHGNSSFQKVDYLRQRNEVALNVSTDPWFHLGYLEDLSKSWKKINRSD